MTVTRHQVLDSHVDAFTLPTFMETIEAAVSSRQSLLIANHNMMSLVLHRQDAKFRDFYRTSDYVFVDGAPVIGLANLRGARLSMRNRLAVLDWIWPFFAAAEAKGWVVVHVGGAEPMLTTIRHAIRSRHPNLRLILLDGYFDLDDPERNAALTEEIGRCRPDVLLVGMGMPRQEHWLSDNPSAMSGASVVITVGGVLAYIGRDRATPPRWLGPLGIEWLFRLATEPRRLWRRYLVDTIPLAPVVMRDVARACSSRIRKRFGALRT